MRKNTQRIDDGGGGGGGRGDVKPVVSQQLELFEPEEIARPDYNVGKYATVLFASPYHKNLTDRHRIEWTTVDTNKDREAIAAIEIHPLHELTRPTTTSFKVFMGILQIWRLQGSKPSGKVYFSDRQLAEVSGWYWTGRIAKRIKDHLDILQGTSINWELSFKNSTKLEKMVNKMHLLEEVTYLEKRMQYEEERFTANQIVRINPVLVQNMLNNHVRPINFEALRQISSDASTRLYMMLDLYLAKKTKWERRSVALLKTDLGYEGKRYDNRGERKRTLQRLIRDLDGKELTSGKLSVTMEETADKKDWKIVARKVGRRKPSRTHIKPICDIETAELLAQELSERFESGAPKIGYMIYLCERYPEPVLRDALSRALNDYRGTARKMGAVFVHELRTIVEGRGDLKWHKPSRKKSSDSE